MADNSNPAPASPAPAADPAKQHSKLVRGLWWIFATKLGLSLFCTLLLAVVAVGFLWYLGVFGRTVGDQYAAYAGRLDVALKERDRAEQRVRQVVDEIRTELGPKAAEVAEAEAETRRALHKKFRDLTEQQKVPAPSPAPAPRERVMSAAEFDAFVATKVAEAVAKTHSSDDRAPASNKSDKPAPVGVVRLLAE